MLQYVHFSEVSGQLKTTLSVIYCSRPIIVRAVVVLETVGASKFELSIPLWLRHWVEHLLIYVLVMLLLMYFQVTMPVTCNRLLRRRQACRFTCTTSISSQAFAVRRVTLCIIALFAIDIRQHLNSNDWRIIMREESKLCLYLLTPCRQCTSTMCTWQLCRIGYYYY